MTTTADVNERFAAERAELIGRVTNWNEGGGRERALADSQAAFDKAVADGQFVALGGGRYQQTYGMDKGEVWTVTRPDKLGQLMAMPEHGLDEMAGGKVRLYSSTPAWHGLGQVIPGGTTDVDDVITLGGLDIPAVRIPVPDYQVDGLKGSFAAPGQFILANGLTGEFWGITGRIHRNLPVRGSFAFMQDMCNGRDLTWESAGTMRGGRLVFISARVPGAMTVDPGGLDDQVDLFVVVQDARDGSGAYWAMLTPWRPLCKNTNRFAFDQAVSRIALRHTTGLPDRAAQAARVLGLKDAYMDAFAAEETALARTATTIGEFRAVMAELFGETAKAGEASGRVYDGRDRAAESKRTRIANDRRESQLEERFAEETGRAGDTLYAAEQAYTGYLAWDITRKGSTPAERWTKRIESELAGEDDTAKTRAHRRLMTLTNR
jgi:phage/plasmid-like protein (TIGR03299 family)